MTSLCVCLKFACFFLKRVFYSIAEAGLELKSIHHPQSTEIIGIYNHIQMTSLLIIQILKKEYPNIS